MGSNQGALDGGKLITTNLANKRPLKKWALTVFILGLTALAWSGTLNVHGKAYIDRIFEQALVTFAVARVLNGVISVAQGTKLAIEPAGMGVNFAPGEVLDPVNDLIERFSWVMLASVTSLGIQKLLLEIAGGWGIRVFLLVCALLFMARLWWPLLSRWKISPWVDRLLLMALFLNLAMPAIASVSSQVFEGFIKTRQQTSINALERESGELGLLGEALPPENPHPEEKTWHEEFSALMGGVRDSLNFEAEIQQLKAKSEEIAGHVIDLIALFMLQTILLPLILLWLFLRVIGKAGR